MKAPQCFIDGDVVTCTVFNENDVQFMATSHAVDGDWPPAIALALEQAKKTREEYASEPKED